MGDRACRLKDEESSGLKNRADQPFWRCPATRFECNTGRTKSLSISALSCLLLVMAMNSGHYQAHQFARIGAIAIAVFLEPIKPKWKAMAVIMGVTALSAVYWGPQDFVAEKLLEAPPLEVRTVTAEVQVGGECITVAPASGPGSIVTVCFYQDGFTIAAAHPVDLSDGPWPIEESHILPAMIRDEPEFVASTPYGMVLSGLGPPGERREQLEIGGAGDITVGQEAELYSSWKGTMRVRVLGYTLMHDGQFLVFQCCDKDQTFEGGMSGSPIVQGGKIIAFGTGNLMAVSWKRPQIGLARLAVDVYLGIQPYLH